MFIVAGITAIKATKKSIVYSILQITHRRHDLRSILRRGDLYILTMFLLGIYA